MQLIVSPEDIPALADSLASSIESAVASALMRSPVAERVVKEAMGQLLNQQADASSPWRDRAMAARYLCVSPSMIDKLANTGVLPRHFIENKPMFHVSDLDKVPTSRKTNDARATGGGR